MIRLVRGRLAIEVQLITFKTLEFQRTYIWHLSEVQDMWEKEPSGGPQAHLCGLTKESCPAELRQLQIHEQNM